MLLEIPYGTTLTYGDIVKYGTQKELVNMSAQAVGGAVGHNPIFYYSLPSFIRE